MLAQDDSITAIFCANDAMAMGCYQALFELGKKVPTDISVVGFDGLSLTESMVPPLTTIAQPIFEIGYTAAKFLVDAIEYPNNEIPNKVFNTKLIKVSYIKFAKAFIVLLKYVNCFTQVDEALFFLMYNKVL